MIAQILIHIPSFGSASLIEVIWTAVGTVGMVIVIPGLLDAIRSLENMAANPAAFHTSQSRKAAAIIARGYIREEMLRLLMLASVILVGVVAMLTPAAGPSVITLTALILTAGLFVIATLTALQTFLDMRQRALVRKILYEEEQTHD